MLDKGWYVCLEEPFTQPRAGLDEPEEGRLRPSAGDELGRPHVGERRPRPDYPALTHIRFADAPWLEDPSSRTSPGAATARTWPASRSSSRSASSSRPTS